MISEHPDNQGCCSQSSSCAPQSHERKRRRFPSQQPFPGTHTSLSLSSALPLLLSLPCPQRRNATVGASTAHLCTVCHRFNVLSFSLTSPGSAAWAVPGHCCLLRQKCSNRSLQRRGPSQGQQNSMSEKNWLQSSEKARMSTDFSPGRQDSIRKLFPKV